jgi:hypothetical protein
MQTALADERWFKWSYVLEADAAVEWASAPLGFSTSRRVAIRSVAIPHRFILEWERLIETLHG